MARGRLKEAKKWFAHRGWKNLPRGIRGQRILEWGADQAWLAADTDQKRERSVRNWCRCWKPRIKDTELDQLVARTVTSNKRWSHDECAIVLEVGVRDRADLGFRFIGADDDPSYEIRLAAKAEKHAARSRRYRAAHSTGAKSGRPALQLSEEERLARRRAQGAERAKRLRASRKTPCRHLSLRIDGVTGFSVTDLSHAPQPDHPSRAPQAPRRQAPIIVDTQDSDNLKASWGDVVDRIDDPEHAPCAVAAGATKGPKLESRTTS